MPLAGSSRRARSIVDNEMLRAFERIAERLAYVHPHAAQQPVISKQTSAVVADRMGQQLYKQFKKHVKQEIRFEEDK